MTAQASCSATRRSFPVRTAARPRRDQRTDANFMTLPCMPLVKLMSWQVPATRTNLADKQIKPNSSHVAGWNGRGLAFQIKSGCQCWNS